MLRLFILSCSWALLMAVASGDMQAYLARVRRALQLAGISAKEAAISMGLDKGQFSRQLDGIEHLSAKRLALLPPLFHQWYGLLLSQDYGVPQEVTRSARLLWALRARRKMARMPVQPARRIA